MTAFENLSPSQKIRASLHRDVRGICTEALHLLGMEISKPAMEIVAELVYRKLKIYGTDLEAFAKHAKRNTVSSEDVKLLVRRNPSLKTNLNKIQPSNPLIKDKRRKTIATAKITTPLPKPKDTPTEVKTNEKETENIELKETEAKEDKESERKDVGSKSDDSIEKKIASEVEHMSVDDIVDLTFD